MYCWCFEILWWNFLLVFWCCLVEFYWWRSEEGVLESCKGVGDWVERVEGSRRVWGGVVEFCGGFVILCRRNVKKGEEK